MTAIDTLISRNADFAAGPTYDPTLRMVPALRTIVVACVDGRIDPADVLGLTPGEVVVLRNVGGRVTPDVLRQLSILRAVTRAAGGDVAAGWQLLVLQHTDCGITRVAEHPELPTFLGVDAGGVAARTIDDPHAAVLTDVDLLRADDRISQEVAVAGAVYDVATGRVTLVPGSVTA